MRQPARRLPARSTIAPAADADIWSCDTQPRTGNGPEALPARKALTRDLHLRNGAFEATQYCKICVDPKMQ
jgi:hypothetical protein